MRECYNTYKNATLCFEATLCKLSNNPMLRRDRGRLVDLHLVLYIISPKHELSNYCTWVVGLVSY